VKSSRINSGILIGFSLLITGNKNLLLFEIIKISILLFQVKKHKNVKRCKMLGFCIHGTIIGEETSLNILLVKTQKTTIDLRDSPFLMTSKAWLMSSSLNL